MGFNIRKWKEYTPAERVLFMLTGTVQTKEVAGIPVDAKVNDESGIVMWLATCRGIRIAMAETETEALRAGHERIANWDGYLHYEMTPVSKARYHEDTYKCIAVSTGHLSVLDREKLDFRANDNDDPMVMARSYGWFLKLYPDAEPNQDSTFSPEFQRLVQTCFEAGYRMIEFDGDAPELDGFDVEES